MSEELKPNQALFIWKLLTAETAEEREPQKSKAKPDLKKDLAPLLAQGYVTVEKRGRAQHLLLTDKAWAWAERTGDVRLMKSNSKVGAEALEGLLHRLIPFLDEKQFPLASIDLETLRSSFGRGSTASSVIVQLEKPTSFDGFENAVEHDKQLGLEVMRETDYYEKQSEGTSIFIKALGIVVTFFFSLGAMIGAMITMYAAVSQRSKEIGTLRALGFSRFSILVAFVFESLALATVGGVLGALASLAMGFVKLSMMNFNTWQEVTFSFDASPGILGTSVLIGGIMGFFGGLFPAIRAARLSPIQAMRG